MKLTQMQEALKLITTKGSFKQLDNFVHTGAFQLEVKSYLNVKELELLQKQFGFKSWEISLDEATGLKSEKKGSFFVRLDW